MSMSVSRDYSAALPIAHVSLRILIVLNWLMGAAVLALLTATIVAEEWTLRALGIDPGSPIRPVLAGLRGVAVLGMVCIPINDLLLRRLRAIVGSVRQGDPFVASNAQRLQAIAWALLALQVISMLIGGIGDAISTPENPVNFEAGFSVSGWLAVFLTFILARIFAEGARMRDDLEGTV
jgi:hypothetical protein